MPESDLIDHSPYHPEPVSRISSASNLVLIDNYDSFTWNVYQYLVLEGATVTVYRNDEVSLGELVNAKPTQLVVSPGPGHPDKDSGISKEAIEYFSGKIPVLGVCMGEQCIFSVFGGHVEVTGEILHGKTSPLRHDSRGLFLGLSQDLPVTRYHSLAGTHSSLPECLEVTSWIAGGPDGGKGIIMGVRHQDLLVEGVQFHPESILTADGRHMLQNFLRMRGGTWRENETLQNQLNGGAQINGGDIIHTQLTKREDGPSVTVSKHEESILEKIYRHRKQAVEIQKLVPSHRLCDLLASYELSLSPPQISFPERLRNSPFSLSLMAEIKRASPSKGIISLDTSAPAQARKYALAGASVISVLTEPEWFKGSIEDLRSVRQSLQGMPNRPAILRKDFVFDEYQILEARLAGADTVLLIVKMLARDILAKLYKFSQSLGVEPLVEVNTPEEMDIAMKIGAKVIGVNNRNLTNFEVDLDTTSRLMEKASEDTIICALSGITGPSDVEGYRKSGVSAVLVGEALMRSTDTNAFISELLGSSKCPCDGKRTEVLVKICGTRTPEAAAAAIEAGADLIGMILVEGRKRYVSQEIALKISKLVHSGQVPFKQSQPASALRSSLKAASYFDHASTLLHHPNRALLVGVFQNQPLSHILEQQRLLNLDVIQLHGSEPIEWANLIPVPVIRRFGPEDSGLGQSGYHALPLLDSASGGTGEILDMSAILRCLELDNELRVILAGGLDSVNVKSIFKQLGQRKQKIAAVDVSSGIEEGGVQSLQKIKEFVRDAKAAYREP